jgi:hypothetical protein
MENMYLGMHVVRNRRQDGVKVTWCMVDPDFANKIAASLDWRNYWHLEDTDSLPPPPNPLSGSRNL